MNFWNGAADLKVMILGGTVILLFSIYICMKVYHKKYIFSLYNIGIFTGIFMVCILPFMYEDKAWLAFGRDSAAPFYNFLNKNAVINLSGIIIFYVVLMISEFRRTPSKSVVVRVISKSIDVRVIGFIFCTAIAGWYVVVFIYNGTLPLLNGRRDFYKDSRIANVLYILFSSMIPTLTIYYGLLFCRVKNRKNLVYLLAGSVTCLFSGNRSDLLMAVAYPMVLVMIYRHGKSRINSTIKIVLGILVILLAGLAISLFRSQGSTNIFSMFQEFVYGNTFSDLRDGAYILYGYDSKFDSYLLGKTYLAGLMSFIPSFLSDFKRTWGWGYFSTATLLGMQDHYGLRGGSYCEPYLNFGYVGVAVAALVQGRWLAYREEVFDQYLEGKNGNFEKKYLAMSVAGPLFHFMASSNGLRPFYINCLLLVGSSALYRIWIFLSGKHKSE